jgi:UDP-glucuronate 4-epimerase
MRALVTGAAGFIGAATARALLQDGHEVTGFDNLNDYYDPALKRARLALVAQEPRFRFTEGDLGERNAVQSAFERGGFDCVVHLGAQAGVRHSIEVPAAYINSNVVGMGHILEGCRHHGVKNLVYASTSSVYGLRTHLPHSPEAPASHPMSLYSATKRANELMAHSYSHVFGLPTTGLRFFTVYGPWGRPDMALFRFTRSIILGQPIPVYNNGDHSRDFTYIDDVVRAVVAAASRPSAGDPAFDPRAPSECSSSAPWRIYNVGCGAPVALMRYIELIESAVGRKAVLEFLPAQPGDVLDTCADAEALERDLGVRPEVPVEVGVPCFVEWFRSYYKL